MARLAAGVDLGKTSCRLELVRGGDTIGTAVVPGTPGLAEPGGVDAARAAITAGLDAVRRAAGLAPDAVLDVVAVGAAGFAAAHGFGGSLAAGLAAREVVLTSDAITSHVGAFAGGPGAVVAVGTGAVAIGLGANGLVQVD
ncbi:MAG: glucosamine kinase [Pseudonocardiales bacterium]|nr:glucosamine kinase [Pseudonocardiales bacterium]